MKRENLNFYDVSQSLYDDLGNPRRCFEVHIYEKNALDEWHLVQSENTLGSGYEVVEGSDGVQRLYHRAGDTLIALNRDFEAPSAGRCYVIGDEIPVEHKITAQTLMERLKDDRGNTFELYRQDYSDRVPFFRISGPEGFRPLGFTGHHDLHRLLDSFKDVFRYDPNLSHSLEKLSACTPDNVVSMEYHEWNRFEELVGEPISYDEFKILDSLCGLDVMDIAFNGSEFTQTFRDNLQAIRSNADELAYVTSCVKVEWVNLDEGWNGDYNPDDPTDENPLRFDVYILRNGEWEAKVDASYCTQFPATASLEEKCYALRILGREYDDALSSDIDISVEKLGERLSCISLDDVSHKPMRSLAAQIDDAKAKQAAALNTHAEGKSVSNHNHNR